MKRLIYIAGQSDDDIIGNYVRDDINNMKNIFETYENEGQLILRTDELITKKSVMQRFRDNQIIPWLFYFSGHSDDNFIQFSDDKIPAELFVDFFTAHEPIVRELQLAYLGSCNSLSIANRLIDKNIKVVIASNQKVASYLANIVSKLFFNRFLISKNIGEAFDKTKIDFEFDRNNFNVNQDVDFPWVLLTSSEVNLGINLERVNLSAEQKNKILLNAASTV